LAWISQEVTERFYNLYSVRCPLWVSSAVVDQREVVAHVWFCSDCRHDDALQRNDARCQEETFEITCNDLF
jgi:hypothetical protein